MALVLQAKQIPKPRLWGLKYLKNKFIFIWICQKIKLSLHYQIKTNTMKRCTAKRGDYPCTLWGCSWCSDCALYKSEVIKPHYKSIDEALKVQRPNDEVVKILSTKFAIVKPALMGGGFGEPFIAGISGGLKVFSFGSLKYIKDTCESVEKMINIKIQSICYDFPENKRYNVYLMKISDQRKYKQEYRKLSKLI